ncbi:neutral zinc metallopeptidase [Crossiella sp. CA198]|uniref:neutral zinc metallopeptidase n=1 Tax=Crossiella sp. CA198 TaxID=3455607 RepID=UPI003F8D3B87
MTTPPPPGSWPPPGAGPQQGPRAGWPPPAPVAPPPRPAPIAPQGTRRMPPPGVVQPPPMPSGPYQRPPMPSGPRPGPPQLPGGPPPMPPGPPGGMRPGMPPMPSGGFAPPPRAVMPPPMAAPHSAPRPPGHGGPGGPPPPWMPPQQAWPIGYPPPRRKSAGPVVALVLVGSLVVGAGLIALLVGTGRKAPIAEPGYTYPSFTGVARTTGYGTTATTTTTTGTTTGRGTTSRTTSATSSAPPQPRPVPKLVDNPLHLAGKPVVAANCNLPGFKSNPEALRAFYGAAIRCMHEAWAPAMRAANLPDDPPGLEVVVGKDNSPCSSGGYSSGAFYCGRNHTIYMNARVERNDGQNVQAGPSLGVLAHEYGHHVQSMSGILGAAWDQMYDAGQTSARGLELSRRKELQASCFAGMFLAAASGRASVNRNLANAAIADLGERGDWPNNKRPRDHGSPGNNKAWATHGAKYNNSRDCNTWNAKADIVS